MTGAQRSYLQTLCDEAQERMDDTLTKADDKRTDEEKVTELFLWVFSRKPTKDDLAAAVEHIKKFESKSGAAGKKTAYENILWALVNTKEFWFNQ